MAATRGWYFLATTAFQSVPLPLSKKIPPPIMRLQNKTAIITGAGRGIGRQIALRFAEEGARIVVADLDEELGRETAATIVGNGGQALAVRADVGDAASVNQMVAAAEATFGQIEILVNNAGIGLNKPFLTTTLSE